MLQKRTKTRHEEKKIMREQQFFKIMHFEEKKVKRRE